MASVLRAAIDPPSGEGLLRLIVDKQTEAFVRSRTKRFVVFPERGKDLAMPLALRRFARRRLLTTNLGWRRRITSRSSRTSRSWPVRSSIARLHVSRGDCRDRTGRPGPARDFARSGQAPADGAARGRRHGIRPIERGRFSWPWTTAAGWAPCGFGTKLAVGGAGVGVDPGRAGFSGSASITAPQAAPAASRREKAGDRRTPTPPAALARPSGTYGLRTGGAPRPRRPPRGRRR